jgi:hypothetical protein
MSIEKLIPRYLNLDDDPRLIKNVEMTDAINVRISATEDGTEGVIKNAFGNEIVPFKNGNNWQGKPHALPIGENYVISAVNSQSTGEVVFFVWNENDNHSIYRFTTSSGFCELVYRDAVLNFSKTAFIQANFVRNIDQNMLLYFTDGFSSPKKINVTVAANGGYSSVLNSGTNEQKLQFLTVARMPPLDPPRYETFSDTNLSDNLIYDKNFQFAYQYIYNDGEVSAISKYTDLVVAPNQYLDGLIDNAQEAEYNAVRISVYSSVADVKTIRVLARIGNEGSFFVIKELTNPKSTTVQDLRFNFYNDSTYRYISEDEQNKIYDAVPITAQAQTISGNRLFFGNYTEGYNNTSTATAVGVNYEDEPQTINIPVTVSYRQVNRIGWSQENPDISGDLPAYIDAKISVDLSGYTLVGQASQAVINFSVNLCGEDSDGAIDFMYGGSNNLKDGFFFNWVELDEDLIEKNAGGILNYARLIASPINVTKIINIPANTPQSTVLGLVSDVISNVYDVTLNTDTTKAYQATKISKAKSELAPLVAADGAVRRWMYFQGNASARIQEQQRLAGIITFSVNIESLRIEPKAIFKGMTIWSGISFNTNSAPNLSKEINFKSSDSISIVIGTAANAYNDTEEVNNPDGDNKIVIAKGNPVTNLWYSVIPRDIPVLNNVYSFVNAGYTNYKSFKSGSKHSVGIVYYDDRGRTSFVQKAADAEVKWYSDRSYPYYGGASIDLRVTSSGPDWATRWAPVIRRTGNIRDFIQYSAIEAFNASNPIAESSVANVSNNDVIYVSMRSLEGKTDSFVDAKGALLSYKYVKGDKLRIVSYRETNVAELTFSSGFIPALNEEYKNNGNTYKIVSVYRQGTATKILAKRTSGTNALNATGVFMKSSIAVNLFSYTGGTFLSEKYIYPDVTFTVAGYENFGNNIQTNPILNEANDDTTYSTTGWFLVLEDNEDKSFNKQAVIDGNDGWAKDVIFEIYRYKEQTKEDIYYEIGKSFAVTNGVHSGDPRLTSNLSAYVNAVNPGIQIFTTQRVYIGDIIRDNSNNRLRVSNVHRYRNIVGGITYEYVVDGNIIQGGFSPGATFAGITGLQIVNNSDAVVNLTSGDIYFRLRQLRIGKDANTFGYLVRSVETSTISDFFPSSSTGIGRPFAENPDAKRTFRTGSVTYSDPFVIDSYVLGLSSFNPSKANFEDLNYIHGPIRSLINKDDAIVFLQEQKVGIFPVNKDIIESAAGGGIVTTTNSVVGSPRYYQGDYGVCNNPESVAVERGRVYFSDVRSGKVMRLSQDGLEEISAVKLDTFFKRKFRNVLEAYSSITAAVTRKIIGGVDGESGEFIVSSDGVKLFFIKVYADGTHVTPLYEYLARTDEAGTKVYTTFEYNDSMLPTFDTEDRFFNTICDTFDNSLNGIVFLDRLSEGFPLYLGSEFVDSDSNIIYAIATNVNFDFYIQIQVNLSDGSFTFLNDCGDFDAYIEEDYGDVEPFTLGWDTDDSVWNTKYSFVPEALTTIDDTMYSFKGGAMYKHSDEADRTVYYGAEAAAGSVVEVVSAQNPSMVKAYESISLEGTDAWHGSLSNTDQSTSISSTPVTVDSIYYPYGDYEKKERNFYAYVPRDNSANTTSSGQITNLSGTSEIYALGIVASSTSGSVTFTTPINDIPFPVGANLYKVTGSNLTQYAFNVSGVTGNKTISTSALTTGVTNGDTVVAISPNSIIEGDQMRDYYMKLRMSNVNINEVELYAVNTFFSKSNLHNELGQ